jgi:hypothetical protein
VKRICEKILNIAFGIILIYSLFVGSVSAINPTIDVDPESPTPKSIVNFTSNIDDQNIIEVRLLFQECSANSGICHERKNISMSKFNEDTYETSVIMEFDDTTYIQYSLNVNTIEGWVQYFEGSKKDLNLQQNNGVDAPGFELILFIASAIFITILIYKRQR